jgi:cis-3-alkyl-4-acyloxetan-2-one decarboxylase
MKLFMQLIGSFFKRPHRLARTIDEGQGTPVILLHGLGKTGRVWQHVLRYLGPMPVRVVAFDLLGFGASPKPDVAYSIDDHAQAVIASVEKLRLKEPAIFVGHSMGSLIAVRVARLRPDLVRHLILYEMPLYDGLPQKRRYRMRTDLYFKLYSKILKYQPTFNKETARLVERLAPKIIGLEVTQETWLAFTRSLENTIMKQTTGQDIKHIKIPMDVIYGTFDMVVIRGEPQLMFGTDSSHITAHTIRTIHLISPKSSKFIVQRLGAALHNQTLLADGPMIG